MSNADQTVSSPVTRLRFTTGSKISEDEDNVGAGEEVKPSIAKG